MPLTMWFQPSNSGQPADKIATASSTPYVDIPTWHTNVPTMVAYPTNVVTIVYAPGTILTVNTTGVSKNDTSVKVASVTGLVTGMFVATSPTNNYPSGTTIVSIDVPNLTVITSVVPTATVNSGTTYVFTLP